MNWESIYIKEAPKLLAVCRRYVQDLQKAEDLMHDAFLIAIKKQDQYAGKGAIGAWLRSVTVNTVLMYLRKEKGVLELLDKDTKGPISIFEKDEPQDAKSLILAANFENSDLLAAIDALPAHHKIVFNLYVFEEFKHKEIGQKLNISTGTSKSHLARARKKIQKILAEKAVVMKKKNKRAGILPFFGLEKKEATYLDDMFREQLGNDAFPPQGNLPTALQEALKTNAPSAATASIFGIGFKGILFASTASVAVIAIVIFSFSNPSTNENFVVNEDSTDILEANNSKISESSEILSVKDSMSVIFEKEKIIPQIEKDKSTIDVAKSKVKRKKKIVKQTTKPEKLQPVVIKKNIIVRDTVFEIIEK